jgi:hypothetical protein
MATPSNINKTINDEKITPDAKRVKLFSGPNGEKNGFDKRITADTTRKF